MELFINHPRFKNKKLSVTTRSFTKNALIYLDGVQQKKIAGFKNRNKYSLHDDNDNPVAVEVKSIIDPIPTVILDGEKIQLAPAIVWYQYIFILLPLLLILFGGAIGGGIGFVGATINSGIIRSQVHPVLRYILTILVTFACYLTYLLLVGIISYFLK
ncbi:TPA_asm: hypothetical protein GND48_004541 [Salmonella enterica subsp. houtenae serovar 41:z4,z23:-]|nr:hypothetical protein [Salmonella enterica subsp. houtenae serovar 41:z4,z23:-]